LVASLDRFDELPKVLISLRRHNEESVMIVLADDRPQAHELKTMCGLLSPFDNTVMMDIDMFVKENISDLFEIVKDGKIAVYEEKKWGTYNSGLVAFEKNIGRIVCEEWHKRYMERDYRNRAGWKGLWDQDILTNILKMRSEVKISKHQIYNLPRWYNYCTYLHPPNKELQEWDKIKVLHYWYRSGHKPDPKRRSWRVWLGEEVIKIKEVEIMEEEKGSLVAEIKRMREVLNFKPRLNARRIGMLDHLLSYTGDVSVGESKATGEVKGKSFEEFAKEKDAGEKQRKRVNREQLKKVKKEDKQEEKKDEVEYQYPDEK